MTDPVKCRCGGDPDAFFLGPPDQSEPLFYVQCDGYCGARTPGYFAELEAIASWNVMQGAQPVEATRFVYRNHRNEIAERRVRVISIRKGTSEYYKTERWLLRAFDLDKGAEREFALDRIKDGFLALLPAVGE